jgi:CheY-like chemotaxis protein
MPSPRPYTTVVVDDSHELRSLWRLMLEYDDRFAVVAEAADGRSGVAAAGLHQPDLVLLDIAMPVMDGLQALRLIRAEAPLSTVVMHSSFSEDSIQASLARRMGAHGFIRNGQPRKALLAKLETILRRTGGAVSATTRC